jgi:hypothetical protein
MIMRYTHHAIDGVAITLDDLRMFVDEMTSYRNLSGTTVIRGKGHPMKVDFDGSGPHLLTLTAETDDDPGSAAHQTEHARPETAETGRS